MNHHLTDGFRQPKRGRWKLELAGFRSGVAELSLHLLRPEVIWPFVTSLLLGLLFLAFGRFRSLAWTASFLLPCVGMTVLTNPTVAAKFIDGGGAVYNAKHPVFGATGNGTTDDTGAVTALNALGAGAHWYFPYGTYLVNPGATYNLAAGVTIQMAPGATFKLAAGATLAADAYLFTATLGADGVNFINVGFDGNRANQTKRIRAVVGFKANNIRFDNCHWTSWGGSALVASNCPGLIFTRNLVELCGRKWSGASGTQGEQGISVLCDVAASDPYYSPGAMIAFNRVRFCGWDGINFSSPYTKVVHNICHNNGIEFNTVGAAGIYYSSNATMGPHGSVVEDNTVYANTGNGIDTGPNTTMIEGVEIVNNNCHDNCESGIVIADGRYYLVEENRCWNNYQASTADELANVVTPSTRTIEKGGITLTSVPTLSVDQSIVRRNICYDNQGGKTQVYGIQIGSQSSGSSHITDLTCEDNMVLGNLTAAIGSAEPGKAVPWVDAGSYGAFHRNQGYSLTVTSGAVIPNVAEFIFVTMGGATNVTGISNGRYGDTMTMLFNNGNATLKHVATLVLRGAVDVTPVSGNMVTFVCDGTSSGANWREISRNF